MENERLKKQLEFCREIDKEKFIGRQTYKSDAQTKENDAEHAWHMAVMTVLLSEYANEKIDVLKTVTMLLIHDIVEIDAGDTYAYDEEGKKTQREREEKRQTGFLEYCLMTSVITSGISGRSLRKVRHLKQNLHTQWITSSRQC